MKENVNTTSSPEIDWRAEYWKGVRDYIEQEENKLETQRAKLNLDPATTFDTLRQTNKRAYRMP